MDGWVEVVLADGRTLRMPAEMWPRLDALLEAMWVTEEDIYGATQKFAISDVAGLTLQTVESLAMEEEDE